MEKTLEGNDDLNERQFGFRKGRSTLDAVRKVMSVVEAAGFWAIAQKRALRGRGSGRGECI